MSKEKQIQIPQKLFLEMAQYFLMDKRTEELETAIINGLNNKFDAYIKHDLYTKYKTAPTKEQQEQARKEYLDKAGIHSDFRW